jgi:hypothetical protein
LGGSLHAIKKNKETLVDASKEPGLEAIADETKYMVRSWVQNVGQKHDMKTDNKSFKRGGRDQIFGKILKYKNSIQK